MFMLFRPVLYVCGLLALVMAALLLVPTLYALTTGDQESEAFLRACCLVLLLGGILILPGLNRPFALSARQLYLLTTLSWLLLSV